MIEKQQRFENLAQTYFKWCLSVMSNGTKIATVELYFCDVTY